MQCFECMDESLQFHYMLSESAKCEQCTDTHAHVMTTTTKRARKTLEFGSNMSGWWAYERTSTCKRHRQMQIHIDISECARSEYNREKKPEGNELSCNNKLQTRKTHNRLPTRRNLRLEGGGQKTTSDEEGGTEIIRLSRHTHTHSHTASKWSKNKIP